VFSHPKTSTGNESWDPIWVEQENICRAIFVDDGPGACGPLGVADPWSQGGGRNHP
jgi:hypothetical protein